MESTGLRLKNIRLSKGISLEDVHKKTKLHINILKAIEEDSLLNVSPVYTKGFIKIYCKFLGLDAKDFTGDYKDPLARQATVFSGGKPQANGWKFPAFFKSGLVRLRFFKGVKINKKAFMIAAAAVAAFFFLSAAIKAVSSGIRNNKRKGQMEKHLSQQAAPAAQAQAKDVQAQKPLKKEALSSIRLSLRAREDCWVLLKVDGRMVFRRVLKKGQSETWTAKEKMELTLGNAAAVELELDGRSIPPLGRRGQVIKDIRITKEEGLVIR